MIEGYFITSWILATIIVVVSFIRFKIDSKVSLTLEDYLSGLAMIALAPILMPSIFYYELK